MCPPRRRIFPPRHHTPTCAATREHNKGRDERRVLQCAPLTPEQASFPLAAQAARLRRHLGSHRPELVELLTSLPPDRLDARAWLARDRQGWGIESGLHQRLDVSRRDDACRLRHPNAMRVHGILLRLANSLFVEWQSHRRKPHHWTTTDFTAELAAEHCARGLRLLQARRPSLK
jgi:hypothetical protein